jgi:hypothetical protein
MIFQLPVALRAEPGTASSLTLAVTITGARGSSAAFRVVLDPLTRSTGKVWSWKNSASKLAS